MRAGSLGELGSPGWLGAQEGSGVPGRVSQRRVVFSVELGSLGGLQGPQEGCGVSKGAGVPKHNWGPEEDCRVPKEV